MTQNPYAQFDRPEPGRYDDGGFDPGRYPSPMRTSILAICSLVLALLCFLPLGPLAVICGGLAILFIANSRGRLGGLGLAIAGVLVGLFTSVFWMMMVVGAMSVQQQWGPAIVGPSDRMMRDLDAGDFAAARKNFSAFLDAAVTDEQLAEFVAAYKAEAGSYQSTPSTFLSWMGAIIELGPQMQGAQQSGDGFPLPATFDRGKGLVFIGQAGQPQPGSVLPPAENIGVLIPPRTEVWLLDPRTKQPVDHSASKPSP